MIGLAALRFVFEFEIMHMFVFGRNANKLERIQLMMFTDTQSEEE
jgi:hypothetical protein